MKPEDLLKKSISFMAPAVQLELLCIGNSVGGEETMAEPEKDLGKQMASPVYYNTPDIPPPPVRAEWNWNF